MSDLFVFGALRHVPLLEAVVGRALAAEDIRAARCAGLKAYENAPELFPALAADSDSFLDGVLVSGLSDAELGRVAHHESTYGYSAQTRTVEAGGTFSALMFLPALGGVENTPWSFENWQARWSELFLRAAQEIMVWQGKRSAEEMTFSRGTIFKRADAWLALSREEQHPDHPLERDIDVHAHKHLYINFFAMDEIDLRYRRFDGTMSEVINRGAFMVGRASSVLPYDPVRDEVLIIQQFRAATYVAGYQRPWMWEAVAGMVDVGESPDQTALREAREEAGIEITHLEKVADVFPSSGASAEFFHCFVGLGRLELVSQGGGLDCEGEDIRHRVLSFDALMEGIDANLYRDMPLVTSALWLARHRDRLRAAHK